ncbi:hypothetical protein COW36_14180 [bacterium (Candidatus Blackallbacteria) CG17_big_fil_post_rev_8_21_14_2_50_48_46]|uniref:Peptidase S8/S53 domain-containing protein n=1 Tax=bacterium (Candidatus Blackallbacteria) CG17_big_fil_post_rev_8_21_14_2_50_48_46 TaxID=2014261 RepID=A0A2M7G465_9BACT|nr:MAG: hypothetical protein COW36_14180 [bacterium (Candidatus Blackallbacteria) CG17_big_fil_post_rev_8_21_14_2_50_48_46]PIW49941.1 MAG: hypothetical protein COW20_04125 [bacterium (Candidatus Blackallbacteria) CG13_big_fil_rev_8_21_14_2_50_49_14]
MQPSPSTASPPATRLCPPVLKPCPENGLVSGTSMATPAVAGTAALLRSRWPELSREQIKARIEAGAHDLGETGFDTFYGHGRLNLVGALKP